MHMNNRLIIGVLMAFATTGCANNNVFNYLGDPGQGPVNHEEDNRNPDGVGQDPVNAAGGNRERDGIGQGHGNHEDGNRNPDGGGQNPANAADGNREQDGIDQGLNNAGGDNRRPRVPDPGPGNRNRGGLGQDPNNTGGVNPVVPLGYYYGKNGVAIVVVPGPIPLCTPEFWERMAVTLPKIASDAWWKGRVLIRHPKLYDVFIPLEDLLPYVGVTFKTPAQDGVKPFKYRKEKKPFRFTFTGGQTYETWNVIIVNIPGPVKLDSQEFNERMPVTVAKIRSEYWPWIPIYVSLSYPISKRILYEPKVLIWPLLIPFL